MTTSTEVAKNLRDIASRIAELSTANKRDQGDVRLLAVSKKKPVSLIRAAADAGQQDFGENYADEGAEKIQQLSDLDLQWHYIGHIQSNKTRLIAEHYQWVQSIDRAKIARRLAAQLPAERPPLNVCLQINMQSETSKSGCPPAQAGALAAEVAQLDRLNLRGIMAIPAPTRDAAQQQAVFADIADLFNTLKRDHPEMDTLSMGMSGDMESAIACGSTMVRIGTAIFGSRP